jgi:hypothetical protein
MKKYILGAILVLALVAVPFVSSATTIQELQCQIYQITSQINYLTGQACPARPVEILPSCETPAFCSTITPDKWSARLDNIITPSSLILPGSWVKVRGARLTNKVSIRSNQGDLQALYQALQIKVSDSNTRIDFKLPSTIPTGNYELFVTGANGKNSNIVTLIVTGEPKIASVVASTTEGIFPGSWVKVRGERLTTKVNWYNLTGMSGENQIGGTKANTYPVIGARLSDSNRRLDFKIDPREASGTYELVVVGEWGNSNKIPFTISSRSGNPPASCPTDLFTCPGGQSVSRSGANCTFSCPDSALGRPRIEGPVVGDIITLKGVAGHGTGHWLRIRGARLTNNVVIRKYGETATTTLSGGNVSGVSGNAAAFLDVELNIPVGSYQLHIVGSDGTLSNTVRLNVTAE